jgi:uncharacterized protein YgbK (DUF1537 family)
MISCVVVADDLTGANAAGVLLTKGGFRTYAVINPESADLPHLEDCQCVVYPTDSRSLPGKDAYDRVFNVVKALGSPAVKVYSKRIDTTLRGNLGFETDAMLDALADNRIAMVVPCFPSSGRINVGGYLLVHGVPLHKTEAAADPKAPVYTPLCIEIYRNQSIYSAASLTLADLMRGVSYTAGEIRRLAGQGVRSIIFDAAGEDDIALIADAVIESAVPFIAVDPGPFTAALSAKLISPPSLPAKILAVVGSVNGVTREQVEYFIGKTRAYTAYITAAEFLESRKRREAEIDRAAGAVLDNCEAYEICGIVGRGISPEFRVPFEPYIKRLGCSVDDLSMLINSSIAEITRRVLTAGKGFRGLYTCGGDITVAVCKAMGNGGLRLLEEVLPLASYGEFAGGDRPGLKIITKGGMVGERDAMVTCVRYLKEKLEA